MNSRLERLKKTIGKCEEVDEIFTRNRVCGAEPTYYEDIIAGFHSVKRNGFDVLWDLVFEEPSHSRPDSESRDKEPTYIDFRLSSDEADGCLFEVSYLPATNQWTLCASNRVGGDGTEIVRNLAADCRISAGETRQIGEDEAMKLIATLCAFYASQPVTA